MIQFVSALLAGAFLLSGCSKPSTNTYDSSSATHIMCVDSFNKETGDIAIYFDTAVETVPKLQHIHNVSAAGIDKSIATLGICPDVR